MNLFELAKGNTCEIERSFESVLAALSTQNAKMVREFSSWIEKAALISINVKLIVLVELLEGRSYQNIYEWADEQSQLCGRSVEEILRERLQKFYEKRILFDSMFVEGIKFRYGALNPGGTGLLNYDPYCVVLSESFEGSSAYLPGDSLDICLKPDGSFDANAVSTCATPHTHRHLLAARDCAAHIPTTDKPDWRNLVISPGRYFEAIFLGNVTLSSIACVRMAITEYKRMWDMAFGCFSKKYGDAERALAHDFVKVVKAAKNGTIQLEVH